MSRSELYMGVMIGFFAQVLYDMYRTLFAEYFSALSTYWHMALAALAVAVLFLYHRQPKKATRQVASVPWLESSYA